MKKLLKQLGLFIGDSVAALLMVAAWLLSPFHLGRLLRTVSIPRMREHRARTSLTVLGVALGVAVLIAVRIVSDSVMSGVSATVDNIAGKARFTESIMQKPYVIIHTHISLDGRIHVVDSPKFETTSQQYQELALKPDTQVYDFDGYLNGRVTTDDNQTHYRAPELDEDAPTVPEGDFVATADAPMYYVSIDPSGRLAWQQNTVDYGGIHSPSSR